MFILFNDLGLHGPYFGQVRVSSIDNASQMAIVDLFQMNEIRNQRQQITG